MRAAGGRTVLLAHNAHVERSSARATKPERSGETYSLDTMAGFVSFVPKNTFDALLFMHRSEAMVYAE